MDTMTMIDEKSAHKEHTFTTPINGEPVEYTRQNFFQEVDNKATYRGKEEGHSYEDGATKAAAFKRLAELRGVTDEVAYQWIHDIASEMLADYQKDFPSLSELYECDGPMYLMEQIEKMSSLLGIVLSDND